MLLYFLHFIIVIIICVAAKERRILKVRTGDSEYMGRICVMAEEVLRDKLHGEPALQRDCLVYKQMLGL